MPTASEARPINVETSPGSVLLPVQHNTNLRAFDPSFAQVPGYKLSPSGPQDFSAGPVAYTLTPADGGPTRTVKVTVEPRNNPVITGYFADPETIYSHKNKRFYLYPTTDGVVDWNGSVFHAFSSENLVDWKDEGVILDLGPDVSWADRRAWAPCIIEKETPSGYRYYYYFCADQKIGVATAFDPVGPFKDSGRPIVASRPPGATGGQQIDPAVFRDPKTGKYYLYWGNNYLAVAELSDDMLSIKEETTRILTPTKRSARVSPFSSVTGVTTFSGPRMTLEVKTTACVTPQPARRSGHSRFRRTIWLSPRTRGRNFRHRPQLRHPGAWSRRVVYRISSVQLPKWYRHGTRRWLSS